MRHRSIRILVVVGFLVGCSSGSGTGSTGTGSGGSVAKGTGGVTSQTGGVSGGAGSSGGASAGTGGAAGSNAGAGGSGGNCWPPCIAIVQTGCWRPTTGTCTQVSDQGGGYTFCYPNGVTEVTDSLSRIHTFSNASGTCFIFADTTPAASATKTYSYKDGAGNEVARATSDDGGLTLMITCDAGGTYTVDTTNAACTTVLPHDCTFDAVACSMK